MREGLHILEAHVAAGQRIAPWSRLVRLAEQLRGEQGALSRRCRRGGNATAVDARGDDRQAQAELNRQLGFVRSQSSRVADSGVRQLIA